MGVTNACSMDWFGFFISMNYLSMLHGLVFDYSIMEITCVCVCNYSFMKLTNLYYLGCFVIILLYHARKIKYDTSTAICVLLVGDL